MRSVFISKTGSGSKLNTRKGIRQINSKNKNRKIQLFFALITDLIIFIKRITFNLRGYICVREEKNIGFKVSRELQVSFENLEVHLLPS